MSKMVSSFIRQALQYSRNNGDSFSKLNNIYKNKISKEKKNMKRENNHRKNHPHLEKNKTEKI
jgi:hypothetical protein